MKRFITLVIACIALSATGSRAELCNRVIQEYIPSSKDPIEVVQRIRPFWERENFSNPREHHPERYRYIVRAMSFDAGSSSLTKGLISASVIGNDAATGIKNISVFQKIPIVAILDLEPDQIVISVPKDTGRMALSSDRASLSSSARDDLVRYYGFYTPDAMIRESIEYAQTLRESAKRISGSTANDLLRIAENPYNELLFAGSNQHKMAGIALIRPNAKADFNRFYTEAKALSEKHQLPLVVIE